VRTVWKYTLTPDVATRIDGGDPRVVHVAVDPIWLNSPLRLRPEANVPTAWVELEPEGGDHITLTFIGTGQAVPLGVYDRHVGSCVTPGGLVWHVYEVDRMIRGFRG
jgi:hypothetical protein